MYVYVWQIISQINPFRIYYFGVCLYNIVYVYKEFREGSTFYLLIK